MLDVTDELARAPSPDTRLHWQVVNIREGDVTSGEATRPYQAPLPLSGGGARVVVFLLLRQWATVDQSGLARFAGDSCPQRWVDRWVGVDRQVVDRGVGR